MANPWFRMYSDFIYNETVEFLSFEDQRHFVFILCMKNEGLLDKQYPQPGMLERVVSRRLGLIGEAFENAKRRIKEVGLIDDNWQPVNWNSRQFISDADVSNAERQRRYRERKKAGVTGNVTHNVTVTELEADTEEETDTEAEEEVKTPGEQDEKDEQEKTDLLSTVKKQVISDFTAIRKAKKAPLTETALKGIKREADKLGYTLEQALTTCCERGWAGFKADWILKEQAQAAKVPISKEQEKREATERARARIFGVNPTEKDITHEATRL